MAQDLRVELHFYGRALDKLAILYCPSEKIVFKNPEILFFCLYTLKLLTEKKLSMSAVERIQQKLSLGGELKRVFEDKEDRPFERIMPLCEYTVMTKSVIRSQIMFRGQEKFSFILGYSGFGIFSNRKHFERCVEGSILGLMERLYGIYKGQPKIRELLFKAAEKLGKVDFKASQQRNCVGLAAELYRELVK